MSLTYKIFCFTEKYANALVRFLKYFLHRPEINMRASNADRDIHPLRITGLEKNRCNLSEYLSNCSQKVSNDSATWVQHGGARTILMRGINTGGGGQPARYPLRVLTGWKYLVGSD